MNKFVSIHEYASVMGISDTAVYKNPGLKPFITVENGKKVVNVGKMAKSKDAKFKTISTKFETPSADAEPKKEEPSPSVNADVVATLTAQIERLNNQVDMLIQSNADKDRTIADQSATISQLATQAQELQRRQLMLTDGNHGGFLGLFHRRRKTPKTVDYTDVPVDHDADADKGDAE